MLEFTKEQLVTILDATQSLRNHGAFFSAEGYPYSSNNISELALTIERTILAVFNTEKNTE